MKNDNKVYAHGYIDSLKGYESPVNVYVGLAECYSEVIEDRVMAEINQQMQVDVNKEELIKALRYDREQYAIGYLRGYADAENIEAIPVDWLEKKARENWNYDWDGLFKVILEEWRQENNEKAD